MSAPPSPYELLGVDPTATAAQIHAAFKDAVRTRTHPPQQVRHAYEQLRHPRNRLRHDLLEPEPSDLRAQLDALLEAVGAIAVADDWWRPLPTWQSLVRPEIGGPEVVERVIEPPEAFSPLADCAGPDPRDALPHFEFPVLP
jgi:hypothetical protein